MGDIRMVGFYYNSDFGWESTAGANEGEYVSLDDHNKAVAAEVERLRSQFAESEIVTKQISDLLSGAMTVGKAQRQHIAELTAEIERLKATRELVDATRISNDLTAARIRISQLEAALAGCAGQWTPVQDMAEFCSCEEDYCAASWRVENGGSRLVVDNGEEELSVELPGNMRMCWQISEAANG